MKELSIEQKAKAYDEAFNVALETYQKQPMYRDWLEKMFPELRESEDEKIRKELMQNLKERFGTNGTMGGILDMPRVLSWLEKQKVLTTEENLQGKEDVLWCIKQAKKHAKDENEMGTCWLAEKWLEKQGEQKPTEEYNIRSIGSKHAEGKLGEMIKNLKSADKVEPKFKVGDIVKHKDNPHLTYILKRFADNGDYEFHAIGKDGNEGETCFVVVKYQDEWELVEPHSSWSEQDESRLTHILHLLDVKDDKKYILMFGLNSLQDLEKDIAWLKSLKDRVGCEANCTTTKEWSEEDEEMLNLIIARLHSHPNVDLEEYSKEYDWLNYNLKSLRPQKQWKPSEEQIKALNYVVNLMASSESQKENDYYYNVFKDLRKQLKKL